MTQDYFGQEKKSEFPLCWFGGSRGTVIDGRYCTIWRHKLFNSIEWKRGGFPKAVNTNAGLK